jgi:para-aminobenzoate synthetase component 1
MKGTIDADIANSEQIILNDEKEKSEHNTIVDLLRNDLSRVAWDVVVKRFRYIDRVNSSRGSLLQVSSEIVGTLGNSYLNEVGSVIFKLLPAGSVSGAPKDATIDIIRKAEQQTRGFYTGVAGYFDGESLNSFVLIRFIERENSELYFRSGGGITAMSVAENEYREAIQKVYLPF